MNDVRDWVAFWDRPHSIYVNARHFDVHYRDIADGIIALLPRDDLRVLDYGSGEALHADRVAARARRLYLCESASSVRDHMTDRFRGLSNVTVVSPDELTALPDGALDFIVANSVIQYLSAGELDELLRAFRRLLANDGTLIVGDVIPPNVSPISDMVSLLKYAARNGFLIAALGGLVRTLLSDYRAIRARLGISTYSEADFRDRLGATGFTAERLARNLEHNPARMTFRARKT